MQPDILDNNLVLRAVQTDADAEKVIKLNAQVHGADEGEIVRYWLYHGHPTMQREDWLFIEDQSTGQAAATLSLMATTWRYGTHPLPVAELGFVATDPDYRRRGLQRTLSDAFDMLARERGYTLAAIEGIPGFYGQFGYEYAIPLVGGFNLDFEYVPEGTSLTDTGSAHEGGRFRFRRALAADVPALQRLYDSSIADLDIAAVRDRALWTYQLSAPENIVFYPPTTIIEQGGQIAGYLRWTDDDWTDRLRILELAVVGGRGTRERLLMALRFARDRGLDAEKRGLTLQLPENHPVVGFARYLGPLNGGHYGWQMKVLDAVSFIEGIRPALEARLSGSLLADYSGTLAFDLYRSRLELSFEDGRLTAVKIPERVDDADARMSMSQATQLWLGWRGREALEDWYPDFSTKAPSRSLLDVLFPKARAYIYMPY
jgi:predicted N-acetyltransferase YhbS